MIRRRAALYFLFMNLPILHHVILVPLLWDIAGRDAWLSVLIAAPFGVFIAYLTWKLMNIDPERNLLDTSTFLFGYLLGFIVNVVWMVYFILLAVITLIGLMDLLRAGFFNATPMWVISGMMMILVVYSLHKGIKVVAWVAGILVIFILISGHLISSMLIPERDLRHMLPFLEFGLEPVIWGSLLLAAVWTEMLSMAVLRIKRVETKGMLYVLFFAVFANIIMMLSTAVGTITVFGMEQADNLEHPVYSSVRMVGFAFIDRFDIYALTLMTLGCFIRGCFYVHATIECLPKKLRAKYPKLSILFGAVLIYTLSLLLFPNKMFFAQLLKYYIFLVAICVLPFLYLAVKWIRKY